MVFSQASQVISSSHELLLLYSEHHPLGLSKEIHVLTAKNSDSHIIISLTLFKMVFKFKKVKCSQVQPHPSPPLKDRNDETKGLQEDTFFSPHYCSQIKHFMG